MALVHEEDNPHARDMAHHIESLREVCPGVEYMGSIYSADGSMRSVVYQDESFELAYDTVEGYVFFDTSVPLDEETAVFVIHNASLVTYLVTWLQYTGTFVLTVYVLAALLTADDSPYFIVTRHVMWFLIWWLRSTLSHLKEALLDDKTVVEGVLVSSMLDAETYIEQAVLGTLDALLDGHWLYLFVDGAIVVSVWWWWRQGPGLRQPNKPLLEATVTAFDRYRRYYRTGTLWFAVYFYAALAKHAFIARWNGE
jgi:hypothetical protein